MVVDLFRTDIVDLSNRSFGAGRFLICMMWHMLLGFLSTRLGRAGTVIDPHSSGLGLSKRQIDTFVICMIWFHLVRWTLYSLRDLAHVSLG